MVRPQCESLETPPASDLAVNAQDIRRRSGPNLAPTYVARQVHNQMTGEETRTGVREPRMAVERQSPMTVSPMPRRPAPKSGDVLASRPTARADVYAISVIPSKAHIVVARYQDAIERVEELARGLAVDGWYTCDHTHFAPVARHRRLPRSRWESRSDAMRRGRIASSCAKA